MQVASIGAMEVALANLSAGTALQQTAAAATAAQSGAAVATPVKEKQEIGKVRIAEKGDHASPVAGQQMAQASSPAQEPVASESSASTQAVAPTTEKQLFEYLMEVERSGGGPIKEPSELLGSALRSIDTTVRQVEEVLGGANRLPPSPEGATPARAASETANVTQGGEAAGLGENDPARLLERSISVMWAAANLEVVLSGVTAASSSVGTLIKQQ